MAWVGDGRPGDVGRRWGIGLCAVALLVGGILAVAGFRLFARPGDRVGSYPGVAAGEQAEVEFTRAGGITVYFESNCFTCGDESATTAAPELEVVAPRGETLTVEGYATDGTAVPRYEDDGLFSYSRGDVDGAPVLTVRLPEPGTYSITVGDSPADGATLRFGPSVFPGRVRGLVMMVMAVVLGGLTLVAGVIVWITATARRRRHEAAALAAAGPVRWGPPPP
jgi:hypothetical protein